MDACKCVECACKAAESGVLPGFIAVFLFGCLGIFMLAAAFGIVATTLR